MKTSNLLAFLRMEIEEIRRLNLRAHSARLGGDAPKGGDAKLARVLKVDKNQIYQWLRAEGEQRRNMRSSTARSIEAKLQIPRGSLDIIPEQQHGPAPVLPAGMQESRSKNNVKALRYAMQSLFSVLHETRSELAEAVAADIVATAGTEFSGQGFLNTLVGLLRGVPQTSEAEPPPPQPVQVVRASRRGSAAK